MPALLPTFDPKSLNGSPTDRLQYGREAVSATTAVSVRKKYEVFILPFPDSSRVTNVREAACTARSIKFSAPAGGYTGFEFDDGGFRYLAKRMFGSFWLEKSFW